jgi:predicted homoserine dehydrogenase-like protein
MIIVDKALEARAAAGNPIQVGVVGAGFAGRGLVHQITLATPGMAVSVVCNRDLAEAARAFDDLGVTRSDVRVVNTPAALDEAIAAGQPAITDDPTVVTRAQRIDVVVEATGEIVFGADVAVDAIDHGKHLVLLNAELDSTLGPILKYRADRAGVVFTDADGDQPGVIMNLAREARMLGFEPIVLGNIKSLLDHRRTPTTQEAFARNVFQRPKMITSFADGTKIAAEMACVANASGFGVSVRGMEGPECKRVEEAVTLFPVEQLAANGSGLTDYILGAEPSFGVFVLAVSTSAFHERYMKIYKMGEGPVYTFYRPYHLSPLETPLTIARAVLFGDAAVAPLGPPVCDVVAIAKRDLKAGEILDGVGGYTCFGDLENSSTARRENLLPIGLIDGARLTRDLPIDAALTFDDVVLEPNRTCDQLWREQLAMFSTDPAAR